MDEGIDESIVSTVDDDDDDDDDDANEDDAIDSTIDGDGARTGISDEWDETDGMESTVNDDGEWTVISGDRNDDGDCNDEFEYGDVSIELESDSRWSLRIFLFT